MNDPQAPRPTSVPLKVFCAASPPCPATGYVPVACRLSVVAQRAHCLPPPRWVGRAQAFFSGAVLEITKPKLCPPSAPPSLPPLHTQGVLQHVHAALSLQLVGAALRTARGGTWVEKEGGEMGRWEVGALKCVPAPRKTWSGVGVGRGGCGHGCVRTVGWEGHMSVPHGGRLMVCVRRSRTRERAGENASGPLCVCLEAARLTLLPCFRPIGAPSPLPPTPYPTRNACAAAAAPVCSTSPS